MNARHDARDAVREAKLRETLAWVQDEIDCFIPEDGDEPEESGGRLKHFMRLRRVLTAALASRDAVGRDTERLDYIERTFSGMTNRERYLPVVMVWGKGANGRTLREACDKYMARDAARGAA